MKQNISSGVATRIRRNTTECYRTSSLEQPFWRDLESPTTDHPSKRSYNTRFMGLVYLPNKLQKKTWNNISQMQANIPARSIRHGKNRFYRHYSLFYGFFGNLFPSHKKTKQTSQLFNFWRSFGCWYTSILLNVAKKNVGYMEQWKKLLMVSRFPSVQNAKGAIVRHECIVNGALGTFQPELRSGKTHPNSEMNFCTYWVWWTSSSDIRGCLVVSHAQPFSHTRFLQWFLSLHGLFFGWEEVAIKNKHEKHLREKFQPLKKHLSHPMFGAQKEPHSRAYKTNPIHGSLICCHNSENNHGTGTRYCHQSCYQNMLYNSKELPVILAVPTGHGPNLVACHAARQMAVTHPGHGPIHDMPFLPQHGTTTRHVHDPCLHVL